MMHAASLACVYIFFLSFFLLFPQLFISTTQHEGILLLKMNNKKRSRPESSTSSTSINHPTKSTRYIDEFIRLDCAPLLLELKIFPDSKEITEAMSTFHAYRRFIQPNIPKVSLGRKCVVCVGDGSTPRCASIFALRCKGWEAIAIDPQMHLTKPTKKKVLKNNAK